MEAASQSRPPAPRVDLRTEAERDFRWNAFWFTADYAAFGIGAAFVSQSTVLPTLVSQLTDSPLLVGMVATIQSGAWLLPQLLGAGLVAGKPRKRPYMLAPVALGRPLYLLLGLFVLTVGAGNPGLLIAALFATMALFFVADGLCAVAWFDILGKAVPADRRGRVMGIGQISSGLASIAAGGAVSYILDRPSLPFPNNFAALFLCGGVAFTLDVVALGMIREPREAAPADGRGDRPSFRAVLGPALRRDARFARAVAVRLVFGVGMMVYPFYIVYAEKALGLGTERIGLFLAAQVVGGILGGLVLGQVGDRRGPQAAIRTATCAAILAPGLTLATHFAGAALGPALVYAMAGAFVAVGVAFSSYVLAFVNYVMEIAPEGHRSTYAGLFNAISGALLVVPALAGWLLAATSYTVVFGAALALILVAAAGSFGLPRPRRGR